MKFTTVIITIVMTVTALTLKFVEGDLNYTSLMREYLLLCGPEYFCFESRQTYKWEIGNNDNFRNQRLCPECRCDKSCVNRGDCCPDLFFSFPKLECVNRTIIKATENDRKRDSQFSALMVTDCPTGSDPDVSMKCTNLTDTKSRLLNFPVTAVEFPIHYYNRHCAKCNNVTEFKTWKLDIFCGLMADFNYLSSVEDVISMAFEKKSLFPDF
ncbi:hypothetical protein FSP39_009741 [Pinctada imbricata]|uniref:SMB domain-containing protein n=1 Tax=Pinctada imbricata TaxID=66713 RepID=A0AA88XKW3_PINIB|nr:hypothetical protein FSP39_009741 [Pinctada imbricata]